MNGLPAPTEAAEQRVLAAYLDALGLDWAAVPNSGYRGALHRDASMAARMGAQLKAEGVKAGVPDVLVFSPPPGLRGIVGVAVELKRQRGGRVTPEQAHWLERLRLHGWEAFVAHGADEAIKRLQELGYGH